MRYLKFSLLSITVLLFNACEWQINDCIDPIGEEVTRIIDPGGNFSEIELDISAELIVTQGSEQEITIEGAPNLIDAIELDSRIDDDTYKINIDGCSDTDGIKIFAQLISLEGLYIDGSGTIKAEDPFNNMKGLKLEINGSGNISTKLGTAEKVDAKISGSGAIQIEGNEVMEAKHKIEGSGKFDFEYLNSNEIKAEIEGSGKISGKGKTNNLEIKIQGSGEHRMKELISQDVKIDMEGSGYTEVHAENTLKVKIDGSGEVCFFGQPTIDRDLTGSGSVNDCN